MHSSRMHTTRLLTVSHSAQPPPPRDADTPGAQDADPAKCKPPWMQTPCGQNDRQV